MAKADETKEASAPKAPNHPGDLPDTSYEVAIPDGRGGFFYERRTNER